MEPTAMTQEATTPAYSTTAAGVIEQLDAFETQLVAATDPNRAALAELVVARYGAVEKVYAEESFTIWSRAVEDEPSELETIHHLAIMHHARAMDRERDAPEEANLDWEAAVKFWFRLWQEDRFWESLLETMGNVRTTADNDQITPTTALETLRTQLPEKLLNIHYDIALDQSTPVHRAKFHLALIHDSPFPPEAKDKSRSGGYEKFTGEILGDIWNSEDKDSDRLENAILRIISYLQRDPAYERALLEVLRLENKQIDQWWNEFGKAGRDVNAKSRLARELVDKTNELTSYFDHLTKKNDELPDEDRNRLGFRYRVLGNVSNFTEKFENSRGFYQKAMGILRVGDEEYKLCRRGMAIMLRDWSMVILKKSASYDRFAAKQKAEDLLKEALKYAPEEEERQIREFLAMLQKM